MQDIQQLRKLYDLKHVYRILAVDDRFESVAEHSWSAMLLANYFFSIMNIEIDKLKVYELLIYHDLAELETGDIPPIEIERRKNKKEMEEFAMANISSHMPDKMAQQYRNLFDEYERKETLEARFANAIDKLDADLHCAYNTKQNFEWWTEEIIRNIKQKHYQEFPEINEMFEKILITHKEHGFI
jgi:putative hydrolases of HD superfamily